MGVQHHDVVAVGGPRATGPTGPADGDGVDLSGHWRVVALVDDRGRDVDLGRVGAPITLSFDPDAEAAGGGPQVQGSDGCNGFGGPYLAAGSDLEVPADGLMSNALGCARSVPLPSRLGDVASIRARARDGGVTELLDAAGLVVVRLERAPSDGTMADVDLAGDWRVRALYDDRGREVDLEDRAAPVTLDFDPVGDGDGPVLRGADRCNAFGGAYRLDGDDLRFPGLLMTTEVGCGPTETLLDRLTDARTVTPAADGGTDLLDAAGRVALRLERRTAASDDRGTGDADADTDDVVDLAGRWRVTALVGPGGRSVLPSSLRGGEVTLGFQPGAEPGTGVVRGHDGCAGFRAAYDAEGEDLRVRAASSGRVEPLCGSVAPLAARLTAVRHVSVSGDEVTLHSGSWMIVAVLRRP